MKAKLSFTNEDTNILYVRYKEYLISGGVTAISFIVFLLIVPAQINNVLHLRDESAKRIEEIKVLSNTYTALSKEDENKFDSNLSLATQALPDTKDFEGLISGISSAGLSAGVRVSDYGLDIGDIAPEYNKNNAISSLILSLTIDGGVVGVERFTTQLARSFPLSEVTEIQTVGSVSRLSVNFYFKPFPPTSLEKNKPISLLSKSESQLIQKLSGFGNAPQGIPVSAPPQASSSAF